MEEDLPESGSHTALFRQGLTQRGTVGFLLFKTKLQQLACLFCHKPHTSSTPVCFGAGFRPARNAALGLLWSCAFPVSPGSRPLTAYVPSSGPQQQDVALR